jgi:predicted dehydrogenase
VDIDPAALEKARAAGVLEGLDVYDNVETALRGSDADAVLATAAIAAHGEVVLAALRAGRHVLVEKPFTASLREARQAVELAGAKGLTLAVGQNYRYDAATALVSRVVRERELGEVRGLAVDFRRHYPFDDSTSPHPELDHSILVQIAIHHFDLMRAILNREPVRMYCHTWRPPGCQSIAPQAAAAVVEFDGGLVATYRANMLTTGEETPWWGVWRIECDAGEIFLRGPHYPDEDGLFDGMIDFDRRHSGYVELRPRGETPKTLELPALLASRELELEAFVRAVETGAELPISGSNNLPSLAMMMAALESARRGQAVMVTTDP